MEVKEKERMVKYTPTPTFPVEQETLIKLNKLESDVEDIFNAELSLPDYYDGTILTLKMAN